MIQAATVAAAAYDQDRRTEDAVRCYRSAAQLLDGERKAECLLKCWRLCIMAIKILQEAKRVCSEREKDGWGARECWKIVSAVSGERSGRSG